MDCSGEAMGATRREERRGERGEFVISIKGAQRISPRRRVAPLAASFFRRLTDQKRLAYTDSVRKEANEILKSSRGDFSDLLHVKNC
jgi:hypothetical protein